MTKQKSNSSGKKTEQPAKAEEPAKTEQPAKADAPAKAVDNAASQWRTAKELKTYIWKSPPYLSPNYWLPIIEILLQNQFDGKTDESEMN